MWRVALLTVVGLRSESLPRWRQCAEPHYRWSAKIDTTLAPIPPRPASIAEMLQSWTPAAIRARDRCVPRAARELLVYRVRGWVRRLETSKDDGDWHIELTDRRDSPADSCIVAEIPPGELWGAYRQARADLRQLVAARKRSKHGVLAKPVEVQLVGAAFFDGHHRAGARRRDPIDPKHGRCNSSLRALWEIHPVYRVERP
jgi:hypothetical protein